MICLIVQMGIHPYLKEYLGEHIDLETVVILEKVFKFRSRFDKKLDDPVWETVSMKIRKYDPFININVLQYKKVLRELVKWVNFLSQKLLKNN